MSEYEMTTLALLDFEIDNCVSKKEYYEKRLINLYELRENMIAEIQNKKERIDCCKGCQE